ncbi:MAG: hypothetical protein RML33_00450 [Acidobacteriota bacterium]|nr:hypothetical protein [Pyrinomonadaceae bacterium]MDW8303294.1 hypothetical protein [Acidobacteriota bacterium]
MKISTMIALLLFFLVFLGCGYILEKVEKTIVGDMPMKKASQLWKDVPQIEGAKPIQMEDPPLPVKIAIGLMLKQSGHLEEGEKIEWIAFETERSAQEIKQIYSAEKMRNFGNWLSDLKDMEPCQFIQNTAQQQGDSQALGCSFEKEDNGIKSYLIVFSTKPETEKNNLVFYLRAEKLQTPK